MTIELTRKEFLAWLRKEKKNRHARLNDVNCCPLARYGQKVLGVADARGGMSVILCRSFSPDKNFIATLVDFSFSDFANAKTYGDVVEWLEKAK